MYLTVEAISRTSYKTIITKTGNFPLHNIKDVIIFKTLEELKKMSQITKQLL
jgi:hypothetical protein